MTEPTLYCTCPTSGCTAPASVAELKQMKASGFRSKVEWVLHGKVKCAEGHHFYMPVDRLSGEDFEATDALQYLFSPVVGE